jgi:hypothetical protein
LHFIVFLVQVTFVLLLCGSSYLAGSIVGHNSSLDGTGMGVICLIHGDANDRSGKQSGDDVDCRMTNEQLIELHVRQELEKHRHRMERVDSKSQTRHFPLNSMGKTLNGMTRVKKMTSISILTLAIQPTVAKAPLWKMHSHYTRRNKHCRVPTNSWHTLQNTTLEWAFP